MFAQWRSWLYFSVIAALLAGSFRGGQLIERQSWQADALAAQIEQAKRLKQAQERSDAAEVRYDQVRKINAAQARKHRSALALATGRECLSAGQLDRLLGVTSGDGLPADTGSAAGRSGTGATVGADDRAVIEYAERVNEYAENCRAQVNAIRESVGR